MKNKKLITIISIAVVVLLLVGGAVYAGTRKYKIYKGEGGQVVRVYGLPEAAPVNDPALAGPQENYKVGDIIEGADGVKCRVHAIAEDGSFITAPLDGN